MPRRPKNSSAVDRVTSPPAVVIKTDNRSFAHIDPPVRQAAEILEYSQRTFEAGAEGIREAVADELHWRVDDFGRMKIPVAIVPKMVRHLKRQGLAVTVQIVGEPVEPLQVAKEAFEYVRERRAALLEAVGRHWIGRIEAASDIVAVDECEVLCKACPTERFVIMCPSRETVNRIRRQLGNALDEPIGLAVPSVHRLEARILVGTPYHIPKLWLQKDDVLLLPFGQKSMGNEMLQRLHELRFARVFAWTVPARRQGPRLGARLEIVAGDVILPFGRKRMPVTVAMVETPDVRTHPGETALSRKRKTIWNNGVRNQFIAKVAKAFAAVDAKALSRLGLPDVAFQPVRPLHSCSTAILVDCPEHGRRLLALLRGWTMLDMTPTSVEGRKAAAAKAAGDQSDSEQSQPIPRHNRVIVTTTYAAMHTLRANVVIRATGTSDTLLLKKFPRRQRANPMEGVLIVDFRDGFAEFARRDAQRRIADYGRRSFDVLTPEPEADTILKSNPAATPTRR